MCAHSQPDYEQFRFQLQKFYRTTIQITHRMVICAYTDNKQWKQEECVSVHLTGQCQHFTCGKIQEYVTYPEPSMAIFHLNDTLMKV
jgi:hypothetical protein